MPQLLHQQGVAAASAVDRSRELGGRRAVERHLEHGPHRVGAQRRGAHGEVRLGLERGEKDGVAIGLAAAKRRGEKQRETVEPACEIGQEAQRWPVAPVEVVDGDERGRALGEVRGQPEQSMQRREDAALALAARRTTVDQLEQRRGGARRPREERRPLVRPTCGQPGLVELTDHPERVVALQLAAAGAQHLEAAGLRLLVRGGEQPRLPDARGPVQHEQRPAAFGRVPEHLPHRRELGLPLQQGAGPLPRQKTGGFSRAAPHRSGASIRPKIAPPRFTTLSKEIR